MTALPIYASSPEFVENLAWALWMFDRMRGDANRWASDQGTYRAKALYAADALDHGPTGLDLP